MSDGGRPPGIGVQTRISNRPVLLWFKRSWWWAIWEKAPD